MSSQITDLTPRPLPPLLGLVGLILAAAGLADGGAEAPAWQCMSPMWRSAIQG
jgi:hypothetical protein